MIYISADTETTGFLDNPNSRVWQVSYVVEDTSKNIPIKELPSLCLHVDLGKEIVWENGALMMNLKNIEEFLKLEINPSNDPICLSSSRWVKKPKIIKYKDINLNKRFTPAAIQCITKDFFREYKIEKALFAGKNVAGFDIPFLETCNLLPKYMKKYHRVLDPSVGFIQPEDLCPPALHEIIDRIPQSFKEKEDALDIVNSHHSLDDARCIILAFRYLHSIGKVTF